MDAIKNMRVDLEKFEIEDNPFDYLLYKSLELSRALLFAGRRYKNNNVCEAVDAYRKPDALSNLINDITKYIGKLALMNITTVALCRDTSAAHENDLFNTINNTLLEFERLLPTKMDYGNPARNDEFEKIRLGEDSPEYQRLLELRKIYEENKDEFKKDPYLYRRVFYNINNPDSVNYNETEDIKKCEEFIKKYNLTEDDIDYIISYYELRGKEK